MPWDVEATKKRIYDAALVEFAEFGLSGTTVERIAKRARINRERVYNHFGDKAELFSIVIGRELDKIAAAAPLAITTIDDVGQFAESTFDYQRAHPEVARLVLWEGLSDNGAVTGEDVRAGLYRRKVAAVAAAQEAGIVDSDFSPAHLVFLLISLSSYWSAAPQIARMLSGSDVDFEADVARRRDAVVRAARKLAEPRTHTRAP
ncbi:MAG TPA: TetR family transcriptional regulator [Jiangellaceae bacterium]